MSMDQWDKVVAPLLRRIEHCAQDADRAGREVLAAACVLPFKPEWKTRAEDALDKAAASLRAALAGIEATQEAYRDKPVTMEAAE